MTTDTKVIFPGVLEVKKLDQDITLVEVEGPVNTITFGNVVLTGLFSRKKLKDDQWYVCANIDWSIKGPDMEVPSLPPGYYVVTLLSDAQAT